MSKITNTQDSDPSIYTGQTKIALFFKLKIVKLIFAFFVISSLFMPVRVTHAGFLSFLGDIFGGSDKTDNPNKDDNSQNMSVLQASLSPDILGKDDTGDVTVDKAALVADQGPLGTAADVPDDYSDSPDQISLYVVRKGDSLADIAKMFDVSVNTISWANDLKKGQALEEGQTLVILPISGVKYTIKKGDTLAGIAKKFKGDIDEIGTFNGLTTESDLTPGDTVIIPDGEVAAPTPSQKPGKHKEKTWGTAAPVYAGYYMRPITGGRKTQGLHGYNGVDLAAPTGTPIYAAASGTVIVAHKGGWGGGYGSYVVIEHDNHTQTLYAHMSKNISDPGEVVSQGQIIGYVGSTGHSTGPHVHFEIRGAQNPF